MNKEEQIILGFTELLNKIVYLNKPKMENSLKGYNPSEIHCIEYIAKNKDSNVTKLATALYMTTSAISKLTKKLITKGVIENYKKTDNKKEVYFRLTDEGKAINKIHEKLHKEFQHRDKAVFCDITDTQFDNIISFIENYNNHLDKQIKKQDTETNLNN